AFILPVLRKSAAGVTTGLAMAAISADLTLSLTLRNSSGEIVQGGQASVGIRSNAHVARFIEELFPTAATEDFEGSITITADRGNVSVVGLQIGGRPGEFTALPVAPLSD